MTLYRHLLIALLIAVAVSCVYAHEQDIVRVNNFWNQQIASVEDKDVHGKDFWQAPSETWKRRTGDCDDYAVAKYYTLLALGVPRSQLKLANVALDMRGDLGLHIVVLYTNQRGTWVLDNIAQDVMLLTDRWDIKGFLAVYDDAGTTWVSERPVRVTTPKQWNTMRSREASHRQAALAAYKSNKPWQ
jgi:predicted transglutaminase-like cysteine proteinase